MVKILSGFFVGVGATRAARSINDTLIVEYVEIPFQGFGVKIY